LGRDRQTTLATPGRSLDVLEDRARGERHHLNLDAGGAKQVELGRDGGRSIGTDEGAHVQPEARQCE
jgi:hypothetical protein